MLIRSSGVLLPVFCLPSRFGIGDLGPWAYRFADSLSEAGQRVWQVLPVTPTEAAFGHSPYHSPSSFAFNPLLISPELLVEDGLLDKAALPKHAALPVRTVAYAAVERLKESLLDTACTRFRQEPPDKAYQAFCSEHASWLDDFARFAAFGRHFRGTDWHRWPAGIRRRDPQALRSLSRRLEDAIERTKIRQYLFHRQWERLRDYCRKKGVRLFGDLPIYVPFDSADVWSHRQLFQLNTADRPLAVSGVPPDYFSATGQLWGHPVYRWEAHRNTRYEWWARRIAHHMHLFDYIRIDHFRGLVAYWEVPAQARTARGGRWVEAPADDLFTELHRRFVSLPLIAEDLGHITADVRETMQRYGLPGMRVLMFGFSGDPASNPNALHNIPELSVVYTGTHDNSTVRGWFDGEVSAREKQRLAVVLGRIPSAGELPWDMIRLAMMSRARLCILPAQDLLGLGEKARINTPGRSEGNWLWRMTAKQFAALPVERLREMTAAFGRV